MNLAHHCQHKGHDSHVVHFYHDEKFLSGALLEFVRLGLDNNEGIILITTLEHAESIKKDLPIFDPLQVIFVDADMALANIMSEDFIDQSKFKDFIGSIIIEMRRRHKNLRFFGEMVDILCAKDMNDEAHELEGYWNELLDGEIGISLMCGYSGKNIIHSDRISSSHSLTVSAGGNESTDISVLQSRIAALEMRVANHKLNEKSYEKIEKEVTVLKNHIAQSTKLSLLGEMTSNLAYELLNPLTVINSYTSVLKSVMKDEVFSGKEFSGKQVEGIENTVLRMTDIMKSILLLSNPNAPKFIDYSVSHAALTAVELMRPQLKEKNIILVHHTSPIDLISLGDTSQMIQLILNMLSNSRDAIEKARGTRGGIISFTEKLVGNTIELMIDDNGIGMKEEVMDNIFKSFYTSKPAGKGSGLGLSVVQKTVEDFKGTISCTSMHQQGTQFTIVLPGRRLR